MFAINRQMAAAVNDLGDGLRHALQEQMKSERMKADLITNVSHDLKTPLTSIINYVDLLKREELHNEKANEYLECAGSEVPEAQTADGRSGGGVTGQLRQCGAGHLDGLM